MTLDQDEQLLVDALHRAVLTPPNLSETAVRATRVGTRLRRRRQAGVGVAVLTVVGAGAGGAALVASIGDGGSRTATSFAGSSTPSPTAESSVPPQGLDTASAYAVLDAPGWTAPQGNVIADEKLYYVQEGTDASVSLNWRPSDLVGSTLTAEEAQAYVEGRYGGDQPVGTTTIDGDPANVFGHGTAFVVVGPIRQGRFLTLSGTGLTLDQMVELAPHVHRQASARLAGGRQ